MFTRDAQGRPLRAVVEPHEVAGLRRPVDESSNDPVDGQGHIRDGFAFLCMGFTGKEAAKWKEAYIRAFNWMAEQLFKRSMDLRTPPTPRSSSPPRPAAARRPHGRWACSPTQAIPTWYRRYRALGGELDDALAEGVVAVFGDLLAVEADALQAALGVVGQFAVLALLHAGPVGDVDGRLGRAIEVIEAGLRQLGEHLLLGVRSAS